MDFDAKNLTFLADRGVRAYRLALEGTQSHWWNFYWKFIILRNIPHIYGRIWYWDGTL
jgi:hypothetical protein